MSCVKCPQPCATCDSNISCLSCIANYFLHNANCVSVCPDGYYAGLGECTVCSNPCLTCTSSAVCLSCTSLSLFNGTCIPACPATYYSQPVTMLSKVTYKCTLCMPPCINCNSLTSCLSCTAGLTLFNNTCIAACPSTYYQSNGICFACSYPCLTCNSTGCLSCATVNPNTNTTISLYL